MQISENLIRKFFILSCFHNYESVQHEKNYCSAGGGGLAIPTFGEVVIASSSSSLSGVSHWVTSMLLALLLICWWCRSHFCSWRNEQTSCYLLHRLHLLKALPTYWQYFRSLGQACEHCLYYSSGLGEKKMGNSAKFHQEKPEQELLDRISHKSISLHLSNSVQPKPTESKIFN